MNDASPPVLVQRDNPFATRFTRPGAIAFAFPDGASGDSIAAKFHDAGRCGAVVGPHGSGKTTLLAALVPRLQAIGDAVEVQTLHDGRRRMPPDFANRLTARSVLIVDGYEQLSVWGRREVRGAVRRSGAGLLVTSHAAVRGLPTLVATRPTVELAQSLVRGLEDERGSRTIAADDVRRLYECCEGNLRELFFALYDLYELRRS